MTDDDYVQYGGERPEDCRLEDWSYLVEFGLPRRVITIFRASPDVRQKDVEFDGRRARRVVLGWSREDDEILLDGTAGQVRLLASWGSGAPILVNRSLPSFGESLALVARRYPFYPHGRDLDDAEAAAERLQSALEAIDPASTADPNGFWSAFLEDVANGDYPAPPSRAQANEPRSTRHDTWGAS